MPSVYGYVHLIIFKEIVPTSEKTKLRRVTKHQQLNDFYASSCSLWASRLSVDKMQRSAILRCVVLIVTDVFHEVTMCTYDVTSLSQPWLFVTMHERTAHLPHLPVWTHSTFTTYLHERTTHLPHLPCSDTKTLHLLPHQLNISQLHTAERVLGTQLSFTDRKNVSVSHGTRTINTFAPQP